MRIARVAKPQSPSSCRISFPGDAPRAYRTYASRDFVDRAWTVHGHRVHAPRTRVGARRATCNEGTENAFN